MNYGNRLRGMADGGHPPAPDFSALVNMFKSGGFNILQVLNNPQSFLRSMAAKNPAIAQAMELTQGKSGAEINSIAEKLFMERGLDINQYASQLRQQLGI